MVWRGDGSQRVAKSLLTLIDQVDARWPRRDRRLDGTIGNTAHQANSTSHHNPDAAGVVRALDITSDPKNGIVTRTLAEMLAASRDPRIEYIISDGQIISSKVEPWIWRERGKGADDHVRHVHISVVGDPALYDNTGPWAIGADMSEFPSSGRGSWYSQFDGKYKWVDNEDKPESNALGVPDEAQGISFFDSSSLGKWFEVEAPNGVISLEQQTDIGPAPSTGRLIDISASAAERMGYTPKNFPTDSIFRWRPANAPAALAHLPARQQATAYYALRRVPAPPAILPPEVSMPEVPSAALDACMAKIDKALRPIIAEHINLDQSAAAAQVKDELVRRLLEMLGASGIPSATPPAPAPAATVVSAPATAPVLQKPSVQLSAASLAGVVLAQLFGGIGTPFGMGQNPTDIGTLATLIPLLTGAVGTTGAWGTIGTILGAVGRGVAQAVTEKK